MLAIQFPTGTDKFPFGQRVADFGAFRLWIDNPRNPGATGKEVAQPIVYLAAGIVWRENFNREVWRTRENFLAQI